MVHDCQMNVSPCNSHSSNRSRSQTHSHSHTQCFDSIVSTSRSSNNSQSSNSLVSAYSLEPFNSTSNSHCIADSVLPDPTCDLGWSQWNESSSITQRFASQARRSPNSTALVEYSDTGSNTSLTYNQLFIAASTLAHHLRASGLQRGDVCAIHAYRCSALVATVMGTLMAGCTVALVDPAYPTARRQACCAVARPRAMLQLARAPAMDHRVLDSLPGEVPLDIRVNLAKIEFTTTGLLLASVSPDQYSGDNDVLDVHRQEATDSPCIVTVGPDSIATLSCKFLNAPALIAC